MQFFNIGQKLLFPSTFRHNCTDKLEFEREFALAMGPKIISDSVGGVVLGAPQRTNGLMAISLDTQCFSFSTDSWFFSAFGAPRTTPPTIICLPACKFQFWLSAYFSKTVMMHKGFTARRLIEDKKVCNCLIVALFHAVDSSFFWLSD